ncbi:hypothetical protein, partial [Exiguobacterium sp. s55]|uniref:hypothetical protein n=1 Tax=Exiguobacterium sp. s55 TaxID=2751245 RepID=UPI001BE72909
AEENWTVHPMRKDKVLDLCSCRAEENIPERVQRVRIVLDLCSCRAEENNILFQSTHLRF